MIDFTMIYPVVSETLPTLIFGLLWGIPIGIWLSSWIYDWAESNKKEQK